MNDRVGMADGWRPIVMHFMMNSLSGEVAIHDPIRISPISKFFNLNHPNEAIVVAIA